MIEEIEETDVVKSGIPTAIDDQIVKMSERLGHQEASGSRDQNVRGLTSEDSQEPAPSEQLTAVKRLA